MLRAFLQPPVKTCGSWFLLYPPTEPVAVCKTRRAGDPPFPAQRERREAWRGWGSSDGGRQPGERVLGRDRPERLEWQWGMDTSVCGPGGRQGVSSSGWEPVRGAGL